MEVPKLNFDINEELFRKYIRVLKLARFPKRDEFLKIAMVAAVGIIIIGIVGFSIYEIFTVLP